MDDLRAVASAADASADAQSRQGDRFAAQGAGAAWALTLGSDRAAAEMAAMGERRQKLAAQSLGGSWPLLPAPSSGCPGSSNVGSATVGLGDPGGHREIISRGSLRGRMVLASASLSQSQLA
jgi:hypothetical protein